LEAAGVTTGAIHVVAGVLRDGQGRVLLAQRRQIRNQNALAHRPALGHAHTKPLESRSV